MTRKKTVSKKATTKKTTPKKAKASRAKKTAAKPAANIRAARLSGAAHDPERGGVGFPVVGVGASAGGLEAIEQLFRNMPADIGMAFVLVQHLDPEHKSILAELVGRFTRLKVAEAKHGQRLEPNHIYVIPPKRDLAILNGVLQLMEPTGPQHLRLSIDYLFRSLARDQGANAFCIVLSGAGSDGTLGLREIKGEGGVVLIQDPETAAYDSMPQSAYATGLADAVLAPAEMGKWLKACGWQLSMSESSEQVSTALQAGSEIDRLFVLVRNRTGYDFSQYKEGTIGRRIDRRMVVNGISHLNEYIDLLQKSPAEVDCLWKEFLIRVTQFFRNAKAFEALQDKIIPGIPASRQTQEPIRIWVPGCSTGEEAYSLAMLLQTHMENLGRNQSVQIFATDIDEEALEIARNGIYPNTIAADVPGPFLRRYFVKDSRGFQVSKAIRSLLVFSRHDVTRDPPFSRMDLVSCRNLLIYMRPELQHRVMDALAYALKPQGTLFLGHSESLGKYGELFETVDARAKVYRRLGLTFKEARPPHRAPRRMAFDTGPATAPPGGETVDVQQLTRSALLSDFTPACVVIDENKQVVYVHGHTGMFLEPAIGRASMDILRMAREGLTIELSRAIRAAENKEKSDWIKHLRVGSGENERLVNLRVRRLNVAGVDSNYLMVLFEDVGPLMPPEGGEPDVGGKNAADAKRVTWLEQELANTRETLQNANEELESANEELQSTVEELQSSNEELMTSQEELSSINEELHTVNVELEDKIQMLEVTTNDLENLLVSTEIATIFLDLDLRVRRFTPSAGKVVNLIEGDIGRPLADLVHQLDYSSLIADAEAVLDNVQPRVLDVRSRDGIWYSLRINLYRTSTNAIDGVVLTFVDLTERILAEKRFLGLLELAPDATVITDASGQIVQTNEQAERLFGYARDALVGRPVEVLLPERLRDVHGEERRAYQRHPRTRPIGQAGQRLIALRKDGSEFPADIAIGPIHTSDGKLFVASVRDVSDQFGMQKALQRSNQLFQEFCEWNRARFLGGVDLHQALSDLGRHLVDTVGYPQCWIGLNDSTKRATRPTVVAQFGFPEEGEPFDPTLLGPATNLETRVLRDLQNTGPRRLREQALAWGCHNMLVAPLVAGGGMVGLFAVCSAEEASFDDAELQMWRTLAESLAAMILVPNASLGENSQPL